MEREEQDIEFKDQIVRYLAGEMAVSEREQFENIIESDQDKMDQFAEYRKIWEGVDQLAARNKYDMDGEWNALAEKVDFGNDKIPVSKGRSIKMTVIRIAAVLIIGLIAVTRWNEGKVSFTYKRVAIETGTELFELPDGTKITLNAGSTVRYSRSEKLNFRKVLLKGEAFFEVSRDTLRPFIIDAGSAQVEVLGTSFNVKAYPENQDVEVTVSSGLVAMSSKQEVDCQILLNKGNTGIYNKEKEKLDLVIEGKANALAWKTRILEFTDTPMEELITVLEHTYQSEIILQDPGISEYTITVSFNNQELDAVLKVVARTLDIKIEKEGNKIIFDTE